MTLIRTFSLRNILLAATIAVFALVVSGGLVSNSDAGMACPDWPTCFGSWTPPPASAALDFAHRLSTALVLPIVLAAFWAARRDASVPRWMKFSIYLALGMLALQISLGALIVTSSQVGGSAWLSTAHLGLSLIILGSLAGATTGAFLSINRERLETHAWKYSSAFGRLSLLTLGSLFLLLASGAVVSGMDASQACPGWPLCNGFGLPENPLGWIAMGHRTLVLGMGGLIGWFVWRAWLTQRSNTPVLVASTATGVLFFAQALMGARLAAGFPPSLMVLHQTTAVAVWVSMVVQVILVGQTIYQSDEEQRGSFSLNMLKDFIMLTKPVVVALLLVTTYAGMVIGARAWPEFWLSFWTLLGGFMAAGGSGAINQYIDRYDDLQMQRTQNRPIPAGRLTPGEGLAFGVGLALASFYLVAAAVNILAALLTLAGIIYYVLIYSLLLKKTTVQNIVIGGGAGAIPPLVGWAAATGSLNIPSLFLFAVVFMWTPPHFWALALVRRKDYARAGVPMLPVVRGEKATRWQILIYTLELVALTLLLPLIGLGGSIYLVGAATLGGWLILAAWKLWKEGGNRVAWKMYRYSSMYLALLFVILMVDALV